MHKYYNNHFNFKKFLISINMLWTKFAAIFSFSKQTIFFSIFWFIVCYKKDISNGNLILKYFFLFFQTIKSVRLGSEVVTATIAIAIAICSCLSSKSSMSNSLKYNSIKSKTHHSFLTTFFSKRLIIFIIFFSPSFPLTFARLFPMYLKIDWLAFYI